MSNEYIDSFEEKFIDSIVKEEKINKSCSLLEEIITHLFTPRSNIYGDNISISLDDKTKTLVRDFVESII